MLTKPSLLIPVDDMDPARDFFVAALGAQVKFQDGDRYCALRLHDLDVALVGGSEKIVDRPALTLRSDGLDKDVDGLVDAGADILAPIETGPHERRTIMSSAAGIPLILSEKL